MQVIVSSNFASTCGEFERWREAISCMGIASPSTLPLQVLAMPTNY